MFHHASYGGAAGSLGMWMAMMVPMMLPSLVPVLSRYRRSARGAGGRCSLSCGSLMVALLAVGMTDLLATAAVTLVIAAERLAPAPLRVARVAGVAMVAAGVLTITRV